MSTLVCTLKLSKTEGVTLTIDNADGKITQTITADGTSVTIQVKGEGATSSFVQKADAIAIDCKTFTLRAESIECSSTKASAYEAGETLAIQSDGDMTLESKKNLAQSATEGVSLSGKTVKASGKSEVDVSAPTVKVDGSAKANLSGAQVSISASGQLSAEASGPATFKGAVANVQGNLVNVG